MEKYMLRCIQLAKNAHGSAAPNPMVGCVIVHEDTIIGEGYTSKYGGAHAEANAIASVSDSALLAHATLYVSLEPCSHFGKTPPCADLILKYNIPEVVIGLADPHHKVAGNGIKRLKNSGCKLSLGVLEAECRKHHKRFLTFHEKRRPYIILKWAQSSDGYIAPTSNKRSKEAQPYWITGKRSRQLVHQWRAEEQAILVGANTVLEDNPKLNVRNWSGKSPIRIILDKDLKLQGKFSALDGKVKTIVITQETNTVKSSKNIIYEPINFSKDLAAQINKILFRHHILSLIVEGGQQTLNTFIDEDLWDEARIFTGESSFTNGLKAPVISGKLITERSIEADQLKVIIND